MQWHQLALQGRVHGRWEHQGQDGNLSLQGELLLRGLAAHRRHQGVVASSGWRSPGWQALALGPPLHWAPQILRRQELQR